MIGQVEGSLKILFYQEKRSPEIGSFRNGPTQLVRITLRKWEAYEHGDYVLDYYSIIEGKTFKSQKVVYDFHEHGDAEMIRLAIATFDELLAEHPRLGG